jgi:hypothetical protein
VGLALAAASGWQLKSNTNIVHEIVRRDSTGIMCPKPDDDFPERHVSFLPTIPADKMK